MALLVCVTRLQRCSQPVEEKGGGSAGEGEMGLVGVKLKERQNVCRDVEMEPGLSLGSSGPGQDGQCVLGHTAQLQLCFWRKETMASRLGPPILVERLLWLEPLLTLLLLEGYPSWRITQSLFVCSMCAACDNERKLCAGDRLSCHFPGAAGRAAGCLAHCLEAAVGFWHISLSASGFCPVKWNGCDFCLP